MPIISVLQEVRQVYFCEIKAKPVRATWGDLDRSTAKPKPQKRFCVWLSVLSEGPRLRHPSFCTPPPASHPLLSGTWRLTFHTLCLRLHLLWVFSSQTDLSCFRQSSSLEIFVTFGYTVPDFGQVPCFRFVAKVGSGWGDAFHVFLSVGSHTTLSLKSPQPMLSLWSVCP